MLLKKKSQGGSFYNIKLLSQNIAINSFLIKHEHALIALFKTKTTPRTSMISILFRKKPTAK
jgi:hypothetical protein